MYVYIFVAWIFWYANHENLSLDNLGRDFK